MKLALLIIDKMMFMTTSEVIVTIGLDDIILHLIVFTLTFS